MFVETEFSLVLISPMINELTGRWKEKQNAHKTETLTCNVHVTFLHQQNFIFVLFHNLLDSDRHLNRFSSHHVHLRSCFTLMLCRHLGFTRSHCLRQHLKKTRETGGAILERTDDVWYTLFLNGTRKAWHLGMYRYHSNRNRKPLVTSSKHLF